MSGKLLTSMWIATALAFGAGPDIATKASDASVRIRTNENAAASPAARLSPFQPGLLAIAVPSRGADAGCIYCRLSRAKGTDFTPVEHFMGGPARIVLMRHADKPDDPEDEDLSEAGKARAEHLATYIPQTFGKIDHIIATAQSKHSDRPAETVQPLADALKLKVENDFENDDFQDLVEEVFSDPDYKGKTVVICWHHGKIPAIAALLGAPAGSYPDPWPEDTYNLILDFHFDPNSGAAPTVTQVVEPF